MAACSSLPLTTCVSEVIAARQDADIVPTDLSVRVHRLPQLICRVARQNEHVAEGVRWLRTLCGSDFQVRLNPRKCPKSPAGVLVLYNDDTDNVKINIVLL